MKTSLSFVIWLAKLFGQFIAICFFPVTVPIAVATNYRDAADRLASLPGIHRGGGMLAGLSVLFYLVIVGGLIGGATVLALNSGNDPSAPITNGDTREDANPDMNPNATPASTSELESTSTPEPITPTPTPADSNEHPVDTELTNYERLLSDIEEIYPETARNSYKPPYLEFLGGSYDRKQESITLNFSLDSLDSIDRYESAVARTAGIYVWSHFNSETAYPETATLNYFRDGRLNATARIRAQWMRQYVFGNVSSSSPAPLSYPTYVRAVMGTLKVRGEKVEFPTLLARCEDDYPANPAQCKNSLDDRMPVRFYLPERTATGGSYTNIMGNAQPDSSFDSRQDRLAYTAQKLEENITGTVSLEGYTAADEDDVWKDVDMRIRDVYLENETIVVEQFTRSEVGDDSLPLRQNDVIGAKYGRLVVNYGAEFMPTNGVVIIKYTPDGQRYSKVRVQNYNAVGYINGERGLVELGLDMEVIEQYQEPGS